MTGALQAITCAEENAGTRRHDVDSARFRRPTAVLPGATPNAAPVPAGACGLDPTETTADATPARESADRSAELLSAIFGLHDALPRAGRLLCRGAPGKDGMPVTFSSGFDQTTTRSGDRRDTTASRWIDLWHCVTLPPATDAGGSRTLRLAVNSADADVRSQVQIEIVRHLHAIDGAPGFRGADADLTPLAPAQPILVAETVVPSAQDTGRGLRRSDGIDCPGGDLPRAVWTVGAGGVTLKNGDEPRPAERDLSRVTVRGADGPEPVVARRTGRSRVWREHTRALSRPCGHARRGLVCRRRPDRAGRRGDPRDFLCAPPGAVTSTPGTSLVSARIEEEHP